MANNVTEADGQSIRNLAFMLEIELTQLCSNVAAVDTMLDSLENDESELPPSPSIRYSPDSASIDVSTAYLNDLQTEIDRYRQQFDNIILKEEQIRQQRPDVSVPVSMDHILSKMSQQLQKVQEMWSTLNTVYAKHAAHVLATQQQSASGKWRYGKVMKEGYLTKQGQVRRSWKKRWFVLTTDGYLRYYDENKTRFLHGIDLSQAQFLSVETEHSHFNRPFVFTFKVPNRKFIFAAENEEVRKLWIAQIQKAMLQRSAGTMSPSASRLSSASSTNAAAPVETEMFYTLNPLEWKQLQQSETLADLLEELEEIAEVQLIEPNKLKIIAISDAWVQRHLIVDQNDEHHRYIDWSEMTQIVTSFFEHNHGDVIMQGWLLKKMAYRQHRWKKRWVVLKNDHKIEYYKSTRTGKRRGVINLANVKTVREIFMNTEYHHDQSAADKQLTPTFVFELETTDAKEKFACAKKHDLNKWVKAIQDNCHFVNARANSDDSDGDEWMLYTQRKMKKVMIDPIIV